MTFGCTFEREESSSRVKQQHSKFDFDCYGRSRQRWQWVHKEEREFHGPTDVRSYTIPVTPICAGDYIEISITLMSLMGIVDPKSISWQPPRFDELPPEDDIRNYNRVKNMTPDRNKF